MIMEKVMEDLVKNEKNVQALIPQPPLKRKIEGSKSALKKIKKPKVLGSKIALLNTDQRSEIVNVDEEFNIE